MIEIFRLRSFPLLELEVSNDVPGTLVYEGASVPFHDENLAPK